MSAPASQASLFSGSRLQTITPLAVSFGNDTFSRDQTVSGTHFGALQPYHGPYDHVTLYTDFNDGPSNHEAMRAFHDVLEDVKNASPNTSSGETNGRFDTMDWSDWAKTSPSQKTSAPHNVLDVRTFSDIPYGHVDYSALTLLRLAGKHSIVIAVTDPGVGNQGAHDRSILVTKHSGIVIGPNNGSLGLLYRALKKTPGEDPKLYAIDINKVQAFERIRRQDPAYTIPEIFHGRDLFAVVAAAIAGGLAPENFVDTTRHVTPALNLFAQSLKPLRLSTGESTQFAGFQDRTFGNIKTNLSLSQAEANALIEQNAQFIVTNAANGKTLTMPFKHVFSDVPAKEPVAYLGSSYEDGHQPQRSAKRFVEFALNLGNASKQLGIDASKASLLSIQRVG
ncbi:MAG: SAM-dependent chlorinase/fluorinase [Vampirovibrionales bacterium]|nr:SAM-dependent chlorinase/fluorinase [Vampirovibrionales bacterium]